MVIGYIATNTETQEQLPIQPSVGEAVDAIVTRSLEMLGNRDVAACKIWEISAAAAEVEAEGDPDFSELCMLAELTGAWEEKKFACLFTVTISDILQFRPFARNCAK